MEISLYAFDWQLLPGYRQSRSQLAFNVILGDPALLPVYELEGRSGVDIDP